MEKEKRIEKEKERLDDIFSTLDDDKQNVAIGLIEEVAFMRATLEDLRVAINRDGTKEEMPQVNYSIKRTNPDLQSYNTMIQRYTASYKELFSLLPKEVVSDIDAEFDEF